MPKTKVILITGAARRLGAALTRHFHRNNNIILHYRSAGKEAVSLAAELNQIRAGSVELLSADFSHEIDYGQLIETAAEYWGRIDVLINNASDFFATPLGHITLEQWNELFASNAKAPLFLAQAALPWLKKAGGCIVNIGDIHASRPLKNYLVYGMAKAALAMLTRCLALEAAPFVRINAVAPGSFLWPENGNELSPSVREKIIRKIPLQKQGDVADIIGAVDYLLTATHVTGQTIVVDGGRSVCG